MGELPAEIGALTELEVLMLDKIFLLKRLPPQIGMLTKLRVLSLDYCGLPRLPAEIGKLRELRVLSVANNTSIASDVELWVAASEKTERTRVDWVGSPIELPDELGELDALEELDVSGLSIKLNSVVLEHAGLDGDFYNKQTEFRLPNSVGRLTRLRKITALDTDLVFPESMHGAQSLREFVVARQTRLPAAVPTFSNLERLDAGFNRFTVLPDLWRGAPDCLVRLLRLAVRRLAPRCVEVTLHHEPTGTRGTLHQEMEGNVQPARV